MTRWNTWRLIVCLLSLAAISGAIVLAGCTPPRQDLAPPARPARSAPPAPPVPAVTDPVATRPPAFTGTAAEFQAEYAAKSPNVPRSDREKAAIAALERHIKRHWHGVRASRLVLLPGPSGFEYPGVDFAKLYPGKDVLVFRFDGPRTPDRLKVMVTVPGANLGGLMDMQRRRGQWRVTHTENVDN